MPNKVKMYRCMQSIISTLEGKTKQKESSFDLFTRTPNDTRHLPGVLLLGIQLGWGGVGICTNICTQTFDIITTARCWQAEERSYTLKRQERERERERERQRETETERDRERQTDR